MTNTTIATAIEMVIAAGVQNAGEIFTFVMDKSNGVTVPMLEEALVEMMVAFKKKDSKATKADFFARALEMDIEDYMDESAAGETLVAENTTTNTIEEEETMTNEIVKANVTAAGVTIQTGSGMMKSLPTPKVRTRQDLGIFHEAGAHSGNAALVDMLNKVNGAKDEYVKNVGENPVTVEAIEFYPEMKEATPAERRARKVVREHKMATGNVIRFIGEVTVRMPEGYAQIKVWNPNKPNSKGTLGAPEFIDFVGYDLNLVKRQFDMRRPLAEGTGRVVLSIVEFVDGATGEVSPLSVTLPTEKGKDGTRYDIFQTNDARFIKTKDAKRVDEPLYVRDNNAAFNAQVTAFVQMYANEFVQADPRNHHGFNKTSCVNMVRFGTKDGVMDDENMASKKSRVILEQPDVMQLAQVGSEQPNTYCMVMDKWLDLEAVHILNEAEQFERTEGLGDDDEVRFQYHDEIKIAGRFVKRNTVRQTMIEKTCAACPHFCGNSPKAESQVAKEKVEAREAGKSDYVSPFYREKAKAKAQVVQSLVTVEGKDKWVNAYPYEVIGKVQDLKGFRIKGAGMTVYGSDEVMAMVDPEYAVPVEEFDARHASVMKDINRIFYAAFNFDKLDEGQHTIIREMEKPEGITDNESERWDNAMFWYNQSIGWAKEREAARNIAPFYQHFFAGDVKEKKVVFEGTIGGKTPFINRPANMVKLNITDVMGDTLFRAESGTLGWGLGYEDLNTTEFVRYLDESVIDYVYEVIMDGTEFCIVAEPMDGDTEADAESARKKAERDMELAAGALQEMLQREINYTFVRGVRRDANPLEALLNLKVCDEVKGYIAEVAGLLK